MADFLEKAMLKSEEQMEMDRLYPSGSGLYETSFEVNGREFSAEVEYEYTWVESAPTVSVISILIAPFGISIDLLSDEYNWLLDYDYIYGIETEIAGHLVQERNKNV